MLDSKRKISSTIFVFISHVLSREILREFKKIEASVQSPDSAWFLFQGEPVRPQSTRIIRNYEQVSQGEILALNYRMPFGRILPGASDFPMLWFYQAHPEHEYYWLIEYDVRFSGSWASFFNDFSELRTDYIAAHLVRPAQEPNWPAWELSHPSKTIPLENRLRCFHPLSRFSNRALAFLCTSHLDGWCGHDEILSPTLLHASGFSIADLAGDGEFGIPGFKNRYFTSAPPNPEGTLLEGTYRYRPARAWTGWEKNKLYHPVKPLFMKVKDDILATLTKLLGEGIVSDIIIWLKRV